MYLYVLRGRDTPVMYFLLQVEVITIVMNLFDEEQIMKMYAKDIEKEVAIQTAERMIRMGKLSLEEIELYVPSLSLDELKEIESEVMQLR